MTRTRLSALFSTIWITALVPGDVALPFDISVWQKPEIIKWKGTSERITCHIKADLRVKRIVIKWLQDNQTEVKRETVTMSENQSSLSGAVFINASLDLLSIHLNRSGKYYCTAWTDLPKLESIAYGKGTHVYVAFLVPNSTTVTGPTSTPETGPANPNNLDSSMWSLPFGLGCVLLIISIACAVHIHYKGHCRTEPKAKEAIVDATRRSPSPEMHETVVYAAINIPQDSVKSRNENSGALALTSVTFTEDSVTYSEVHIKKAPKDEG